MLAATYGGANISCTVYRLTCLNDLPDDVLLRIISLAGDHATQVGFANCLGKVSSRLRLVNTQFLTSITRLSVQSLSCLSLSCETQARSALTAMFSRTGAVRELNLNGYSAHVLSRSCMSALAFSASHSLHSVNLSYCFITDEVVRPLLLCPNLRTLHLSSTTGITGKMFSNSFCKSPIEHLDLSWAHSVTDEGVAAIGTLSTLKHLNLKGCASVNSNTIRYLVVSDIRKHLRNLSLANCPVREQILFEILESMPSLRKLSLTEDTGNIWMAGNISASCIAQIREQYPSVVVQFII